MASISTVARGAADERPITKPRRLGGANTSQDASLGTALMFVGPYLLLFTVFMVLPIAYGIWMSLHQWDFFLASRPFVGLQNYLDLFRSGTVTSAPFWQSMRATAIFTILSVPLLMVIPLALAVLVNRKFRGRTAFRALVFAPFVLGVAVVGLLWRYLLDPNVGVLNYYLGRLGIDPIPFTTATPWVWLALVVPTLWWTVGYNMVIFLAGLQDISPELYEAAEMDGANGWQRFWNVTIPGLRPVLIFVLTITVLASANVFGQPYLITQGQPGTTTRSAIMHIGEEGLARFNMGSASAMSTILTVVLLAVSLLMLSFLRDRRETR
jgi:multiple sugar transport system permease protein